MSNNKPRMVEVTDPEEIEGLTRDKADLAVPMSFSPNGHPWVDADELRAWREARSTHTSGVPNGTK